MRSGQDYPASVLDLRGIPPLASYARSLVKRFRADDGLDATDHGFLTNIVEIPSRKFLGPSR
jgi:hypothetical protein